MNDDEKYIHFGDLRYEDYTKHQDEERRKRYIGRAKKGEEIGEEKSLFFRIFRLIIL
jgi:hypothetical protein